MDLSFLHFFAGELPFDFDINEPYWQALFASDLFLAKNSHERSALATLSSDALLVHPDLITLCEGAKVEGGAQIIGPAYIGKNARVGHGALIRPGTVLLEGASVGHCSEVKRSIFMPYAKAPHFNYVGDSILGSHVNLGAGAILCNQRLDKKSIRVAGVETESGKLGAAIGDGASLGAGVICNPGARIEKRALVPPKTIVTGLFQTRAQLV